MANNEVTEAQLDAAYAAFAEATATLSEAHLNWDKTREAFMALMKTAPLALQNHILQKYQLDTQDQATMLRNITTDGVMSKLKTPPTD